MSKICATCDTKNRLGLCPGKEEDFKYCYRRVGSLEGLEDTITPFNTVEQLYDKLPETLSDVEKDSLIIKEYGGAHVGILVGKYKYCGRDKEYPIGYIIK